MNAWIYDDLRSYTLKLVAPYAKGDIHQGISQTLPVLAEKEFRFDEARVKVVLAKHRKFDPAEWDIYIRELQAAFEQPA